VLAASGCAGLSQPHASVRSVSAGPLQLHEVAPLVLALELELGEHPDVDAALDEILTSPVLSDPTFVAAVETWTRYWRRTATTWLPDFLGRMGAFQELVEPALAEARLPTSLRYLPLIESGYDPRALSRARAVGLWQFMEATARERGLEVSPLFDQRRDPVRSTEEAVGFLSELHQEFGSWFWALAAYNSGPNRVRRILLTESGSAPPTDSSFWALRARFPRETRDYIPKLVAAALVSREAVASPSGGASNAVLAAGAQGATPLLVPTEVPAFRFDVVRVPDATTLDIVARAAGVPQHDIERLNPEYLRGMTPPGRESLLRVPEGRGTAFEVAFAAIPPEERVSFIEHRVTQGETLSHIAIRYGVRVSDLEAANPGIQPRSLRVGRILTVPVAPSARRRGAAAADS
jgi:membrane-bound lytic murein transglycosylase D